MTRMVVIMMMGMVMMMTLIMTTIPAVADEAVLLL